MGKLLASLVVVIVAATASFLSFTLISNATSFTTTYVHTWKDSTGANFANNQPAVSTAAGYQSVLTFPAPVANFSAVFAATAPPSWKLAVSSSIPLTTTSASPGGIAMGKLTSQVNLGLFNGGCATPLTVPIDFFNATTDTTDELDWLSDGANTTYDTDPVQFPADVNNAVPAEADHYPEYLNRIFDVDGPNGAMPPARPFARLYGQVTVTAGSPPTHLNFVVFSPDQFQSLGSLLPPGLVNSQDDLSDSFGFLNFVVLNNPTQPAAPSPVTDFCSTLISTTLLTANTDGELHLTGPNLCGDALDADGDGKVNDGCPVQGTPEEATGTGPNCDNAVDDDGDSWVNDGCNKAGVGLAQSGEDDNECINNFADGADADADGVIDDGCINHGAATGPMAARGEACDSVDNDGDGTTDEGCGISDLVTAAAGKGILGTDTHILRSYSLSYREAPDDATPAHAGGGDGIENALDPCPLTDTTGWDPRSFTPANDTDSDGLPNDCDPAPAVASLPAALNCAGGAGFPDEDRDCFPNRGDNCPLVWNGDNPNTVQIEGQEDFDVPFGRVVGDGGNRQDQIGSACEPVVAASGAAEADGRCLNATSDEGTDESLVAVNDGCPAVGATESNGTFNGGPNCTNAIDDDADTVVNDGCPQMGLRPEGDQCRDDPATGVGEGLDDDGDTVPDDGCNYDNDNDGTANEDPKDSVDNDGDGLTDEDPPDDFDGDGSTADEAATTGGVTNRSQMEAQGTGDGSSAANAKAMHPHKSVAASAVCLTPSTDGDTDGWCDATETALGSNPAAAGSTPESLAVDLAGTDSLAMPGTCNDGADNDGDGNTDAADSGCTAAGGDTDGDGVPDASDNCDNAKNPDQLNTDGDAETPNGTGGDECDIDDDGDTLVDIREYAVGKNVKDCNTAGAPDVGCAPGSTDRAALVAAGPVDSDGDTFTDGVERVVGTNPNLKCVNSRFPGSTPTDRNLRNDADPLDINRDNARNIQDVLKMKGRTPSAVNESYAVETNPIFFENRLDMDGNGTLAIIDILKYKGAIPVTCSP